MGYSFRSKSGVIEQYSDVFKYQPIEDAVDRYYTSARNYLMKARDNIRYIVSVGYFDDISVDGKTFCERATDLIERLDNVISRVNDDMVNIKNVADRIHDSDYENYNKYLASISSEKKGN